MLCPLYDSSMLLRRIGEDPSSRSYFLAHEISKRHFTRRMKNTNKSTLFHSCRLLTWGYILCTTGFHGLHLVIGTTFLLTWLIRYVPIWRAHCCHFLILERYYYRSRGSEVGIATSYELDDRGVRVRVPVGSRIFTSPNRPDRL
jgi:hypothetical protein